MEWTPNDPVSPLDRALADRTQSHRFDATTPDEAAAWRRSLRPVVERLLSLDRIAPCPLNARTVRTEDCGSYIVEHLLYDSEPSVTIPAALLVPKELSTPAAAMLCPPGHGRGLSDQLDSDLDGREGVRALNYDYSRQFAERGYVVLTCEIRGFGSLADLEIAERGMVGNCEHLFRYELMLGRVLAGVRTWDLMRGIDYLVTRPEVDASRIGCAGLSMGGELSMLVSALDERVRVAMISGFLCTYHGLQIEKTNCVCYTIPHIWDVCDMPEIAGLIAPRPLVIETGTQDGCFPWDAVNEAYGRLEDIYAAYGGSDMLVRDIHEAGHRFSGVVAFDWFDQWLRPARVDS